MASIPLLDLPGGSDSSTLTFPVDVPHGGTGATSFTANYMLLGNGASPIYSSAMVRELNPNLFVDVAPGGAVSIEQTALNFNANTLSVLTTGDGASTFGAVRGNAQTSTAGVLMSGIAGSAEMRTAAGTSVRGGDFSATLLTGGTATDDFTGVYSKATNGGAATQGVATGYRALVRNIAAGTIGVAAGYHSSPVSVTLGSITKQVGFAQVEGSAATNNIGVLIGSASDALSDAPTGDWALYSVSARRSHLAGELNIKGVTYNWPAANVTGALNNDGAGNLTWVPSGGGGTVTGTGVAGQAAFWTAGAAIGGDTEFLYDSTNKRMSVGVYGGGNAEIVSQAFGTNCNFNVKYAAVSQLYVEANPTPLLRLNDMPTEVYEGLNRTVYVNFNGQAIFAENSGMSQGTGGALLRIGDNSNTPDNTRKYGFLFATTFDPGTASVYAGWLEPVLDSVDTPTFLVGWHVGPKAATSLSGGVEGMAAVPQISGAGAATTYQDMTGLYTSTCSANAGTKSVTRGAIGVLNSPQWDTGAVTIANYVGFKSDNNSSNTNGLSVGRFTAATVTNMFGFLYTHPSTGTISNEYGYYSEATSTTNAAPSWQAYFAGSFGQTNTLANGGLGTGAKSYIGGRLGVGCIDPIGQIEVDASGQTFLPKGLMLSYYGANTVSAPITGLKGRGSRGTPGAVATGDYTVSLFGAGHDGTKFVTSMYASGYVDGSVSAGVVPQGFVIATGSTNSPTECFYADSTGYVTGARQATAKAYKAAAQSIPDTTSTALVFDTQDFVQPAGSTAVHDTASNNTKFFAPVAGVYLALGKCVLVGDPVAGKSVGIGLNGAYITSDDNVATALVKMAAGDYIEVLVIQTSGAPVNTVPTSNATYGALIKLW